MNKYSELSDDQVDRLVSEQRRKLDDNAANFYLGSDRFKGDYCNNWADAGPLMVGNEISLINNGDEFSATCQSLDIIASFGCEVRNLKNPLRAISECYLLMTDEINEP